MTIYAVGEITLYFLVLSLCIKPLGLYMAHVYTPPSKHFMRVLAPLEKGFYKLSAINPNHQMNWQHYALLCCFLIFLA